MSLTIKKIIEEADIRVQNAFGDPQKVDWLNQVNHEFFDVVKIPRIVSFNALPGLDQYTLQNDVRSKNIDKVIVGNVNYQSIQYEDIRPGRNFWSFDDATYTLTITPAPIDAEPGLVRCYRIATTTFTATGTPGLNAVPDAPPEYHWIYILGLCERIAKAMDDVGKANNYANDYRANLLIAQQNFQRTAG